MNKLTLQHLELKGKKVLLRVDFNVPLNADLTIADDTRIREALPTIRHILEKGGSVIIISHMGRPKNRVDPQFSLAPCAKRLSELLGKTVLFAPNCIGPETEKMAKELKAGEVLLLENLRFHKAEEEPESDPSFARRLASLGDVYVNDAFGAAHRAHASTHTVAKHFPGKAAAGLLIQKELSFLEPLIKNPKRPFYAILGGAKISSKMGVLSSLLSKVDGLFIGGGMAFTLLKAQGISIGNSIHEDTLLPMAKEFLNNCAQKKIPLYLPEDFVIANAFKNDAAIKIVDAKQGIPEGWQGMDIGPKTIKTWDTALKKALTVFWNGPLGVFEMPHFAHGTKAVAETLSNLKNATTIVGGGDSIAAIQQLKLAKHFSHLSTGGGASLELIELGHLPGIDALS